MTLLPERLTTQIHCGDTTIAIDPWQMDTMDRRKLLQLATGALVSPLFETTRELQIAVAVRSDQLSRYADQLRSLPAIEIEDWLDPTFPERAAEAIPVIRESLAGYKGRLLLSGPFIDLNPGSAEKLVQRATRQRFDECHEFAHAIEAREIIFLSSYLPLINLSFYDKGWIAQSVTFWRAYLGAISSDMTISLCNTFEYHPDLMVRVVEEVNRPNFRLAFDLGHFLVYGKEPLAEWLRKTAGRTSCVYVHSNDGHVDTHDEPGEGVLTCKQIRDVSKAVEPNATLILKMNNKDSLSRSIGWLKAC